MYTVNKTIRKVSYKGLQAGKLLVIQAKEILHISLEKDALFPEHSSPSDANLLVLEGAIIFFINDKEYKLSKYDIFDFPKQEIHWVKAIENSKFLIIR